MFHRPNIETEYGSLGRGQALIVMESKEAADAMAEAVRANTGGPARILDVRVGEVVAHA